MFYSCDWLSIHNDLLSWYVIKMIWFMRDLIEIHRTLLLVIILLWLRLILVTLHLCSIIPFENWCDFQFKWNRRINLTYFKIANYRWVLWMSSDVTIIFWFVIIWGEMPKWIFVGVCINIVFDYLACYFYKWFMLNLILYLKTFALL